MLNKFLYTIARKRKNIGTNTMLLKKIFFSFLCALLFFHIQVKAQVSKENPLTLAESVKLALENNKQIKQTKELISSAYAKIEEARSVFYPQLQLQSNYTRLNYVSTFKFELPGFPSEEIKLGSLNNYSAQVSLLQSLYSWNRNTKSVELSEVELTMAKDNTTLTEREITYAVVQLFFQIQMVHEAIKVVDENLKLLNEHLSVVKKKYEAGELSNFDVLSVEVKMSSTTGQKLDAETNLKKLEVEFNKITGRHVDSPLSLEFIDSESLTAAENNFDVDNDFNKRIELKQMQNKESLLQLQKEIVSTTNQPNVNFFFNWDIKNGYLPNVDIFKGSWNTGLMISFPFFDGFRTNSQVNQAEANIRSVQLEHENVKQSIQAEIRQALYELIAAKKKIEIEKEKVLQSEEALKIAEEQYSSGHLSTLDLLDTQQSLKNAKLDYLLSLLNFHIGRYTLDKVTGKEFQLR